MPSRVKAQQPTQVQMFHKAHREVNDTLQQAAWMAGKMADSQGRWNPNPLTEQEIQALANSGKPYAWAFRELK